MYCDALANTARADVQGLPTHPNGRIMELLLAAV